MFIRQSLKAAVLMSMLMYAGVAAAQPVLGLDAAVNEAVSQSFALRQNTLEQASAQANATKGNAGQLPEINLRSSLGYTNSNVNLQFANGTDQQRWLASAANGLVGVELTQTLYDGGRMKAAFERLNQTYVLATHNYEEQKLQLVIAVKKAYYNLARQQQILKTLQKNLGLYQERLSLAEAANTIGTGSKPELLQAKLDIQAQNSAIVRQKLSIEKARLALNYYLRRDSYDFVADESELSKNLFVPAELQTGHLPMVAVLDTRQRIAELQKKEIQAEYKPRVVGAASYNYNYNRSQTGLLLSNQTYGLNAGVLLVWNLYNGKNTARRLETQQIIIEGINLQKAELDSNYKLAFQRAMADYTAAVELVKLETENLKAAEENLGILMAAFRLGRGSTLVVKDAQRSYEDVQSRLLNALYEQKVAEMDLVFFQK